MFVWLEYSIAKYISEESDTHIYTYIQWNGIVDNY